MKKKMSENITNFSDFGMNLLEVFTTETTSRPVPQTPPPPGYYGDTRELLMKVVTPVIIIFGTLGNILTVMVLMRQTKKISSTSMYLLALAVSDTGLLWASPFRAWMKYMWDIDIRYLSDASCRIHLYFTYTFIHFSSWMLVAVTLERTISVVSPYKVKLCCTPRNAGVVIASIFVFIFGIDLVIPMISSIDGYRPLEGHEPVKCAPSTKDYTEFRDNIWQWMDLSIAFLMPFVLLVIGNALIIWHLQKARKFQRELKASRGNRAGTRRRGTLSLTILMIALCVIFFLTMTPVAVYEIYYPYQYAEITKMFFVDPFKAWEKYQYFLLQHTIVNLVSYTNASLNFVLYVFSGTKFRAELKAALCCSASGRNGLFTSMKKSTISKSVISTTLVKKCEKQCGEFLSVTDTQYGGNKNTNYVEAKYFGQDNQVFISDEEISSLSSILSKHVEKSISISTEMDDRESFDYVFTDYETAFYSDPTQDVVVKGKELNGFILHL